MVAAVADVAVPFLIFLRGSVAAFLLVSQTFIPRLTTSCHLCLSCARYSKQLRFITKDFTETFRVSLRSAFSNLFGCACSDIVHRREVSLGGGDLSC